MKRPPRSTSRGVALLVTLAFVVIITILVVAFTDSMRIDRPAANTFLERTRANFYAQAGVDNVIGTLREYASMTSGTTAGNWITQPGQIIVSATNSNTLQTIVPLHSGSSSGTITDPVLQPPNLNISTFRNTGSYLIANDKDANGAVVQMPVKWIYVRKDGSLDRNEPPLLTDRNNPLVGRYAYWTDDESSKVNCNLAWSRSGTNTNQSSHPTKIDLTALAGFDQSMANAIHNFITLDPNYATLNHGFFNTQEDARRVSMPGLAQALETNKFEITHYSHDPDTTFFNESRIVLTTKDPDPVNHKRPYLKILTDETKDPGNISNISEANINVTLFGQGGTALAPKSPGLIYYLSRKDWPMVSGSASFQDKYYAGNNSQLAEFAICIFDYVRAAESAVPVVEPIRGIITSTGSFQGDWAHSNIAGDDNTFKGLTRAPMITEMALVISGTSTKCRVFAEIHLPKNYGIDSVDLSKMRFFPQICDTDGHDLNPTSNFDGNPPNSWIITGTDVVGATGTILNSGSYKTIAKIISLSGSNTPGQKLAMRCSIAKDDTSSTPVNPRLDCAPLGNSKGKNAPPALYTIPATVDPINTTTPPPATSLQTDDPRVNSLAFDWKESPATWNAENIHAALLSGTIPQQDTDQAGVLVTEDVDIHMPYPKGSANNPNGVMFSPGELGYIHTGIQISGSNGIPGIPWRTIRLQPNGYTDTKKVPDWAFMDLFTIPVTVSSNASYIYQPHNSAVGGRVNLNGQSPPFSVQRMLPLAAVAQNCTYDSTDLTKKVDNAKALTIAQNIYNRTWTSQNTANNKYYGYQNAYDSPGEVVEVQGVADGGEQSEELVRQIANLVTARGNVFSVYSIGQALKQSSGDKLQVTGEQRLQVTVERYLDISVTPNQVRFAPVYFRNLTP